MTLDIADKPQRHAGARLLLDAHDLGFEMKRLFAGEIEIEIRGRAWMHLARRPHEETVARDVLDQAIDDEAIGTELGARPDRDSNSCPLVHVVKATLATHHQESNPFYTLTHAASRRNSSDPGRTFSQEIAFRPPIRQIAAPKARAHSSVGRAPAF